MNKELSDCIDLLLCNKEINELIDVEGNNLILGSKIFEPSQANVQQLLDRIEIETTENAKFIMKNMILPNTTEELNIGSKFRQLFQNDLFNMQLTNDLDLLLSDLPRFEAQFVKNFLIADHIDNNLFCFGGMIMKPTSDIIKLLLERIKVESFENGKLIMSYLVLPLDNKTIKIIKACGTSKFWRLLTILRITEKNVKARKYQTELLRLLGRAPQKKLDSFLGD